MHLSSRTAVIIRGVAAPAESDNVRLVRRMYEAWESQKPEATVALMDPDFEFVNPDHAVDPGTRRGHDGFRAVLQNLDASFSEQRHVLEGLVDLGDRVLAHTTFQARGRDSGAQIAVAEQHLWTLRDGKALRLEWFHDRAKAERAARNSG
jgi:ketosteroid isomerase-like protein